MGEYGNLASRFTDKTKNALLRYLGKVGFHRRFGGPEYAAKEKELRELTDRFSKNEIKA